MQYLRNRNLSYINGQRAADKRANSFWQLSPWHQLELLVCLQCWQTGKGFRLHWPIFVRVQIGCPSIGQIQAQFQISRSAVVSTLASRIRDREFESHDNHFPQNQIIIFLLSLSFLFIFLNLEVKQCANLYWKYDNTGFAMEKKPIFYFSKWQIPHISTKQDRLRGYQAFFSRHNVFIEMKMTLHLMTILYKRKKNALWFWQQFGRTITLAGFDIPIFSFNWKSSFVLIYYKSEDGYPNLLFSYLLSIALYTNSTYIIWLKNIL